MISLLTTFVFYLTHHKITFSISILVTLTVFFLVGKCDSAFYVERIFLYRLNAGFNRYHTANFSRHSDVRPLSYNDDDPRLALNRRLRHYGQFSLSKRRRARNDAVDSNAFLAIIAAVTFYAAAREARSRRRLKSGQKNALNVKQRRRRRAADHNSRRFASTFGQRRPHSANTPRYRTATFTAAATFTAVVDISANVESAQIVARGLVVVVVEKKANEQRQCKQFFDRHAVNILNTGAAVAIRRNIAHNAAAAYVRVAARVRSKSCRGVRSEQSATTRSNKNYSAYNLHKSIISIFVFSGAWRQVCN